MIIYRIELSLVLVVLCVSIIQSYKELDLQPYKNKVAKLRIKNIGPTDQFFC